MNAILKIEDCVCVTRVCVCVCGELVICSFIDGKTEAQRAEAAGGGQRKEPCP